jgi:hypothetical protein
LFYVVKINARFLSQTFFIRSRLAVWHYVNIFFSRQLCVLLNAEDIYRNLAHILLKEPNLKFARLMVEHLNMILLTSSELFEMRSRLKELNTEVPTLANNPQRALLLFSSCRKVVRCFVVCTKLGLTIQLLQSPYVY